MKVQKMKEVYLNEEEFSEALRNYVHSSGVSTIDYPNGPTVYHEGMRWRLCFSTESEDCND